MTNPRYINAIDPDVDRSGVAMLDTRSRELRLLSLDFPTLLDYLQELSARLNHDCEDFIVLVEAGWMNDKSNFRNTSGRASDRISKNVGSNHQVGKLIIQMCRHWSMPVREVAPARKFWKGPGGKISREEFAAVTGFAGRTNQEERDAGMLAWYQAGFEILCYHVSISTK